MREVLSRRRGGLLAASGFVATLLFISIACSKSEAPAPAASAPAAAKSQPVPNAPVQASAISEAARSEAKAIFNSRCVTCHGQNGQGDGPASAGLQPPPRDLTSDEWQHSVTDEHIEKIIKFGGSAVGKSPMMPANPDLTSKTDVVAALREHVRNLGK